MVKPDPPASLADTREVRERLDARGNEIRPLDEEQVKAAVRDLVDNGVETLTVSLVNSYANADHEHKMKAIIRNLEHELRREGMHGELNILTFDMGGTTTDVALCEQDQVTIARETMLGYFRVKVPSVNVHSVGAGGLSIEEAAQGILDIVNENMAGALRLVSVQRGYDPRNFALVAYGGAGPMHANAVAKVMGSFPVIVPLSPGLLCATGDLAADFRQEFARTLIRTSDQAETSEVLSILAELEAEATKWMELEGIPKSQQLISYNTDMRYYRQGYEIAVSFTLDELKNHGLDILVERFSQLHDQYYGFRMEGSLVEIVNLRVIAVGKGTEPHLPEGENGPSDSTLAAVDSHQVYFAGKWHPTTIYDRAKLRPGNEIQGPAIVTEFDSTTVILPGYKGQIDRFFNILINPVK